MLVAAAILVSAWALTDGRFRDAEGFLAGLAAFPLAASVALIILGLAWWAGLPRSGAWISLALIGQAAALQLIDAGPTVRYQHYAAIGTLFSPGRMPFIFILVVQAVLCVIGLASMRPGLGNWIRTNFSGWRLSLVSIAFVFSAATFSRSLPDYALELSLAAAIQLMGCISVVMAALSIPPAALQSFWRRAALILGDETFGPNPSPGRPDRFALLPAIIVAAVASFFSVMVYERHAHIPDEVSYLLNAKYFAAGMLSMAPPPVPAAFDIDLMQITSGRWYSPMPPGWPVMLSLGVRLGVGWLVNPLLAGLNVILAYLFLREIYPTRVARLALLLLSASPWYLYMGMNFMTHMLSLTAALGAALAVARLLRTGRLAWAWIGGVAIGALSLVRPLEGLVMAVLLGIWSLTSRTSRRPRLNTALLAAASIAVAALTLPYNRALTGNMFESPLSLYATTHYGPGTNDLGFGSNRGWGWTGLDPFQGHDVVDAAINTGFNIFAVNVELFGWASGSLLFILLLASWKPRSPDHLMVAAILGVVLAHGLYWFSGGPDFGARYWFLTIVPLVALTARAINEHGPPGTPDAATVPVWRARALATAFILSMISLTTFVPWRAVDKYHHYRRMRPDVRELARSHSFGRSLVLIEGKRHPDFAGAAVYNPVNLDADAPIYAWARSPSVAAEARAAFPGRPVWVLRGPTVTGRGYEVAAAPPRRP